MDCIKEVKLPSEEDVMFYLLLHLYHYNSTNQEWLKTQDVYILLANHFGLSDEQRNLLMKDGRNHWENRVQYAKLQLVKFGLVSTPKKGRWIITEEGIKTFEKLQEPRLVSTN